MKTRGKSDKENGGFFLYYQNRFIYELFKKRSSSANAFDRVAGMKVVARISCLLLNTALLYISALGR